MGKRRSWLGVFALSPMNVLFSIQIAAMDNGQVCGVIKSISENKAQAIQAPNMKLLMTRISRNLRKRYQMIQHFPAPEPSRVLQPGEPQILWTPNGD